LKGTFHTEAQGDKTRFYFTTENDSKGVVVIDSIYLANIAVEENHEWETANDFLRDLLPGLAHDWLDTPVDVG